MIKHRLYLIYILIWLGGYLTLNSQNALPTIALNGEPLGVKQGLSQGMIMSMYQDGEGYMWICTKDGLNKYDGYNITIYRNNPDDPFSLPDNFCKMALEDERGNFWIGTNSRGLFLFEKSTEKFYPVSNLNNKHPQLSIDNIMYKDGCLFINTWTDAFVVDVSKVTSNNTLSNAEVTFSFNQFKQETRFKKYANSIASNLMSWRSDKTLWINWQDSLFQIKPCNDYSACQINAYPVSIFEIKGEKVSPLKIFPIPDEPDHLLTIVHNQLIHFNKVTKRVIYKKIIPTDNDNFKPLLMEDGSIYIFTSSQIFIYHPSEKKLEQKPVNYNGWKSESILSFCNNSDGTQWVGSAGFGIFKIDPRTQLFKKYIITKTPDFFNVLPTNYMPVRPKMLNDHYAITQVVLDNNDKYWAYLETKPLQNFNLLTYDTRTGILKQCPGLKDNAVLEASIYNDYKDRLWIYYKDSHKKNFIGRIDKNTGSQVQSYYIPDEIDLPDRYVSQMYLDNDEILWLATINGLYAFDLSKKTWRHWKNIPGDAKSLSSNKLLSICPDPTMTNQYLWIGTEGAGFFRFDKRNYACKPFDEKVGLSNNVAYCILDDSIGNLWISTNKGLNCFNPKNYSFRNFTDDDGLPGIEFNRFTAMKMKNGELMFGGVDGFVLFNPREVLQHQKANPLVFNKITISNKTLDWKQDSFNLQSPVGYAKKLILMPGQTVFSISFATLEYRSNTRKLYKYKLEGFDADWTSPSNKHEVTYTNLSPGKYTFRVMGANTDGVWNNQPISMEIIVLPFWYQTLFFKVLVAVMLALGLYAFYRYQLRQGLKLEKLRNRIARDLHDEIGSTLSSISFYAEAAKKMDSGNKKVEKIMSKINAGTSEMMEAMSDIVWAVKTGSGQFDDLANRLRSFAVHATESKNIELKFTDNKDIPNTSLNMEQRKNIYLICKEAVSNAVKYSECTLLGVFIFKDHGILKIHIRDNGKGFEINNLTGSIHSLGGNGLKNMHNRALEINSDLEIASNIEEGTNVILKIPI